MKKHKRIAMVILLVLACTGCSTASSERSSEISDNAVKPQNTEEVVTGEDTGEMDTKDYVVDGSKVYRDFVVDSVLYSESEGEIHYCVYIPESYDKSKPYALFVTLPGYEGLYFQGVAVNIKAEEFAFEAQNYNEQMIIVAPQLDDWGATSANQTIILTDYFLNHYNIDPDKVYINGYSGGGETLSLVLDKRPELYTAALMCSSQWDGGYDALVKARTPVYFVIGESDEYYGSKPFQETYQEIYKMYQEQGLTEQKIDQLLVLNIKDAGYFNAGGIRNQHGGGAALFCKDSDIMGWLFQK
ncbi:prolyl oligopeptidase family serine peptidase [Anaerocolumna xylanovorans]|uniref:Prolyl oligopeptidase family protein n=1 Tax=Anaerocolumna xylanovorans DSM 12503 TaxID=1121345 RepID=A0A1M7Y129_9FIRM|nr:prolyl oligopeptidase family serine peptidase [Anaerocolumna xylanovorans]SHO45436.1 Prolyl oligopeptidase family protein [Anaerocolumna xylanovorans DSM 12503]